MRRIMFGYALIVCACSIGKRPDIRVIVGDYKVENTNTYKSGRSEMVCIVYDKLTGSPIENAAVRVIEQDIAGFTNLDGVYKVDIPVGKHSLKVIHAGNTPIETKPISFEINTSTTVKFELGTTMIICH